MIDDGDLDATEGLLSALEDTAYKLSIVESFAEFGLDNDAFTGDREFQGFNRVYTLASDKSYELVTGLKSTGDKDTVTIVKPDDNSASKSHYNLRVAYEALIAEVEKQTNPTTLVGDVNGDGEVNALDAAKILQAVLKNEELDKAVADYNQDGAVNALDAAKILQDKLKG
jgi:hypothetical protein